jgi:hypothetical protein
VCPLTFQAGSGDREEEWLADPHPDVAMTVVMFGCPFIFWMRCMLFEILAWLLQRCLCGATGTNVQKFEATELGSEGQEL